MSQAPRKSLYWIASFPKSGNTWLRAFLANYLLGGDDAVSINEVRKLGSSDADARHYTRLAGPDVDLKDPVRVVALRQEVLAGINANGPNVSLIKTHSFNGTINKVPLIPADISRGAVYVVRHPGDVAISFASHYGMSLDETIDRLAEGRAVVGGTQKTALQLTSDWSNHVTSWVATTRFPVHTVRFEDMLANPAKAFEGVLRRIGVAVDPAKLNSALERASFKELQRQESSEAFVENTSHQERFFRSGTAGNWQRVFTAAQKDRLIKAHRDVMAQVGYL